MKRIALGCLLMFASKAWAADCPAPLTKPTRGTACTDTVFATNITRASDHNADAEGSWAVSEYAKRQAFNADNTYYLFMSSTGEYWLHNTSTKAKIKKVTATCAGASSNCLVWDAEPIWHPTDPKLLYYVGLFGSHMKLFRRNVDTDVETTIGTFSGGRLPWPTAASCNTGDEGAPSADGRYWIFKCADAAWNQVGYFTYDALTDTILGTLSVGTLGPADSVGMSASGRYWIGQWYPPTRVRAYKRDMTDWTIVDCGPTHADHVLGADGDDYFVGIDWTNYGPPSYDNGCITAGNTANGYGFSINIDDGFASQSFINRTLAPIGHRRDLIANYSPMNNLSHVSGKAHDLAGKVLFATSCDDNNPSCNTLADAVVIADVTGNPAPFGVFRINNVRIDYNSSAHCTISRNGALALCSSNWRRGSAGTTDMDVYIAETGLSSAFAITTTTLPNGTNGQAYQADAQTVGGTQPVSECTTSAGALPTGASWSVQGSACRLSDASAETGIYNFTLQAKDSAGTPAVDTQAYVLTINAALQIDTATPMPGCTLSSGYAETLVCSGGTPPRTFSCCQLGALPTGLTVNSNGTFSGTCQQTGVFNFTARCTDNVPTNADKALQITVTSGAQLTMDTPVIQPLATSALVKIGAQGLPYDADCQVILKDSGGATVGTQTSVSGYARRTVYFTGLTASSNYSLTMTCDGATPDLTPYPFVTKAAPAGGNRTVPVSVGAPVNLPTAACYSVESDDNEAMSTPDTTTNASCASGCTVSLSLPAGLFWIRGTWKTAACAATVAAGAVTPLQVE